ncbi:MAG: biotin--[acetyl-CoA-carboxylase] ligase [Thermicanus sp.]|nr:biotin--[acetyl-CoA-carboxylase] ligase [Thermicanus sp.]
MREKILESLRSGAFQSGESLAKSLGCSRMAIWKHIEELKREGYRIEAVHRKGYRLLQEPDSLLPETWQEKLTTHGLGRTVYYYFEVDTTQTIAHEKAREGAPHGTLVLTEHQRKGRGRLGRVWTSLPGVGLWMSLVLRPPIPMEHAPHLTLLSAVAVAETLQTLGYAAMIKWPNDIYLHGRKVCGILTELNADMDQIGYAVVGIGINVHHREEDFPEEIRQKATSLYLDDPAQPPIRSHLLLLLLQRYELLYEQYLKEGFSSVKEKWLQYAIPMGWMKVSTLKESFQGKMIGLTNEGALLVKDENGRLHTLYSAELEMTEP